MLGNVSNRRAGVRSDRTFVFVCMVFFAVRVYACCAYHCCRDQHIVEHLLPCSRFPLFFVYLGFHLVSPSILHVHIPSLALAPSPALNSSLQCDSVPFSCGLTLFWDVKRLTNSRVALYQILILACYKKRPKRRPQKKPSRI